MRRPYTAAWIGLLLVFGMATAATGPGAAAQEPPTDNCEFLPARVINLALKDDRKVLALALAEDEYVWETGVHLRIARILSGEVPTDFPTNLVNRDVLLSDVMRLGSCVPFRIWFGARGQLRLASLLFIRGDKEYAVVTSEGWPVVDASGAPLPAEAIGATSAASAVASTALPTDLTASPPGATPTPAIDVEALHVRLPDSAIITIGELLQMGRDFVEFTPVPLPPGVSTPVAPESGTSAGTPPSGVVLPATGGGGSGSGGVWPFVVAAAIAMFAVVGVGAAIGRTRTGR